MMKPKQYTARFMVTALYLGFGLLGVYIGIRIIRQNQIIVHGILGIVIFYLLYRAFL